MENKSNIEEKVNSTLNLLESFSPREPNPYLYGRIIVGIKENSKIFQIFSLKPVLLMLLVFINLISAIIFFWLIISKSVGDLEPATYVTEDLYTDETIYYQIK
jgi:hypothetical protein